MSGTHQQERRARRRAALLLAAVLLMQGPTAPIDHVSQALLALLVLPVVLGADRVLRLARMPRLAPTHRGRGAAFAALTLVVFLAQELYSGVGVAWISDGAPTTDSSCVATQHLLALGLAVLVALLLGGVRVATGFVRSVGRMSQPPTIMGATSPRLAIRSRRTALNIAVVLRHIGQRAPPALQLVA